MLNLERVWDRQVMITAKAIELSRAQQIPVQYFDAVSAFAAEADERFFADNESRIMSAVVQGIL